MKYGFIYLWYDRKHKRFYLGSHWGTTNDGYICSSTWMRNAYKRRPHDFKRRIVESQIEKKNLRQRESVWLNMISLDELGKKYYNLMRHTNGGHWPLGEGRSKETKKRVSEGLKKYYQKGYSPPNKGKPMSEEQKEKLRQKRKLQAPFSEETLRKLSEKSKGNKVNLGRKHSAETIEKRSQGLSKSWSDDIERKQKQSQRMKIFWQEFRKQKELQNG